MESPSARPRWQPPFKPLKTSNPVRRDLTVAPTTHKEYVMSEEQAAPVKQKSGAQQVLEMVTANPGITHDEIKALLPHLKAATISTAVHDLEKSKRIKRIKVDFSLRCYPAGHQAQPETTREVKSTPEPVTPVAQTTDSEESQPLQPVSRSAQPAPAPVAVPSTLSNPTLAIHLTAVAEALPIGVILGVFRGEAGKMEFTLDTSSGATFNMGESLVDVVNGINSLAALQPFAEN